MLFSEDWCALCSTGEAGEQGDKCPRSATITDLLFSVTPLVGAIGYQKVHTSPVSFGASVASAEVRSTGRGAHGGIRRRRVQTSTTDRYSNAPTRSCGLRLHVTHSAHTPLHWPHHACEGVQRHTRFQVSVCACVCFCVVWSGLGVCASVCVLVCVFPVGHVD